MKSTEEKITDYELEQERQKRLEHQNVLLAIGAILKTSEGWQLFKYLFKNFDVGKLPDIGMQPELRDEYLGFLRAGNSIYQLVCEADNEMGASILSKIQRENYEQTCEYHRIQSRDTDSGEQEFF